MNCFCEDHIKLLLEYVEACRGLDGGEHHPEGDIYNHSIQCFWWAMRETVDTDLMLAALLHDIGKAKDRLRHDKEAVEMIGDLVSTKTSWLIENHMRFHKYIDGSMKRLHKCMEFGNHPWMPELVQLARFDKLARDPKKYLEITASEVIEALNRAAYLKFTYEGGKKKEVV